MKATRDVSAVVLSVSLGAAVLCQTGCGKRDDKQQVPTGGGTEVAPPAFSAEVEAVLLKKIEIVRTAAADAVALNAIRAANTESAELAQDKILSRDAEWQEAEVLTDFIKSFMTNECATFLMELQETDTGFSEIFVTDQRGLIVAMTNKTSDYYQADEEWWVKAYADGRGETYYGVIEYDESAMSEVIPLYVPVTEADTGKAIGVVKAVYNITAIKREL